MFLFKNYWKNWTIKKRLIMTFLPLALLPMIFSNVIAGWIYSNQISKGIEGNVANTVNLVNNHLNTYLDEITRMTVLPYYNNRILSIMQESGKISDTDYNQVQALLSQSIRNPRADLQSVSIYRSDGQIFSSSIYSADINYQFDFKNSIWYKRAVEAKGKVVFIAKSSDSRIVNRPEAVFSVARAIKIYNGPILGVIIIDVNYTGLESIFKPVDLGKDSNIIVLDEDHNVVYSRNSNYAQVIPRIKPSHEGVQHITVDQDKLIVNHINSEDTGWNIAGIVSESELDQGKQIVSKTIMVISAIIFLIVLIVSVLLSDTITKPLKTLRMLMGRVEKGDFNMSYEAFNGNLEISSVGRAFNQMKQNMDKLINQVLETRYKQKEAELNNLKLQIQPHFLFNNLEAIRALAEIGDRKGVVDITTALGGMLRYSLTKQNSKVDIREEIVQVQNYLKIEQIRSGEGLRVEYHLDEALMTCKTIPILLQPVVENCIHHGFDRILDLRIISISVQSCNEGILFSVEDNGTGMTADQYILLQAYLANEINELTFANHGIGLKNLHARIQLEYGTQFGLSFVNREGEGMTVHIRIPRLEH